MPETLISTLDETAQRWADRPALQFKIDDVWTTTTWSEHRADTRRFAKGLISLGLEPGQAVVILGANRPEWFCADLGTVAAGGIPAGIYTTNSAEQCAYIAGHCEAIFVVVENETLLSRFAETRHQLPNLRGIILMTGSGDPGDEMVYTWQEVLALGDGVPDNSLAERIAAQRPEDVCTLIYTSGTTGPPKAVMLTHGGVLWVIRSVIDTLGVKETDNLLSYLPLSHIAEKMISLYAPLVAGACSWFVEDLEKLGENLREVRPNYFFGVPRVWEKIQSRIEAVGAQSSGFKKKIGRWARGVGLRAIRAKQAGEKRPALYAVADRLVFSKVRRSLGLDRARICFTAAAPIPLSTLEFFASLGVPVLEAYGLSECTGVSTFSLPDAFRLGYAGKAIPGVEIRLAEDGEIFLRGPHLFKGYFKDESATRETLDSDGWLHTGDIGNFDEEGYLAIIDRKKELIITSGGKNMAPQPIESKLNQISGVAQSTVVGDGRNYLAALLTVDPDTVAQTAEAAGSLAKTPDEAAACPTFRAHIEHQIEAINQNLARPETIKRFHLLSSAFSIEGGELTPTMKLKRRVITEKYSAEIAALYT